LYSLESPTCPATADPFSITTRVSTHAMPSHSGFSPAARRISLLAMVMASRMRCSVVPVWRSSRPRTRSTAIAAARSPAFCPPIPSTTRKMPRSESACHASSLLRRTRPASLPPANLSRVLTIGCAAELQEHHARESDARGRRHGRFHIAVALLAIRELHARRRGRSVDGRAQAAEVLQEKLPVRGIAPQAEMLSRNIGRRIELDIGPVVAAAAAHHDLVLGHLVLLAAAVVLILDHGECAWAGRLSR